MSMYMYLECDSPARTTIEVAYYLQINGKIQAKMGSTTTVGSEESESAMKFGKGMGWKQFCKMDNIFEQPNCEILFSVIVKKIVEKRDNREVITRPAGEQEYNITSR